MHSWMCGVGEISGYVENINTVNKHHTFFPAVVLVYCTNVISNKLRVVKTKACSQDYYSWHHHLNGKHNTFWQHPHVHIFLFLILFSKILQAFTWSALLHTVMPDWDECFLFHSIPKMTFFVQSGTWYVFLWNISNKSKDTG